jgi:hypothetical protein
VVEIYYRIDAVQTMYGFKNIRLTKEELPKRRLADIIQL